MAAKMDVGEKKVFPVQNVERKVFKKERRQTSIDYIGRHHHKILDKILVSKKKFDKSVSL